MPLMRKATLNFVLEGLTLLVLVGLTATGFIMEFRLPPGGGRGGGGGAAMQLGLGRHDWGEIHFWLSIAFIVLIVLHVFLHWRWIWGIARGKDPARFASRTAGFLAVTALILLVCALPWIIPIERGEGGEGSGEGRQRRGQTESAPDDGQRRERHGQIDPSTLTPPAVQDATPTTTAVQPALRGSSSMDEIAQLTGLSLEELGRRLELGRTPQGDERLGRVMRESGRDVGAARSALGFEAEP